MSLYSCQWHPIVHKILLLVALAIRMSNQDESSGDNNPHPLNATEQKQIRGISRSFA